MLHIGHFIDFPINEMGTAGPGFVCRWQHSHRMIQINYHNLCNQWEIYVNIRQSELDTEQSEKNM